MGVSEEERTTRAAPTEELVGRVGGVDAGLGVDGEEAGAVDLQELLLDD